MSRAMGVTTVVLLLVVDMVLLAWLVNWMGDQRHETGASADPSTPAASPTIAAPTGPVSVTMSGSIILRVTQGSCTGTGRPMLEQSADLGRTFTEVAIPLLDDSTVVSTLLAATATSPTELQVVAGDATCTPHGYTTTDAGLTWSETDPSGWFVNASGDSITTPNGTAEPGCSVVSLSVFSNLNAKVLCSNATVRGTNDSGETWVVLGELPDATALTMTGLFDGIGIASTDECASQVMRTASAGNAWETVGCVEPGTRIDHLVGSASRLIALSPEAAWTSTDGGVTWVAS